MYVADRVGFHIATTTAAMYDIVPPAGKFRPDPKEVKYTDGAFRRVSWRFCRIDACPYILCI